MFIQCHYACREDAETEVRYAFLVRITWFSFYIKQVCTTGNKHGSSIGLYLFTPFSVGPVNLQF